MGGYKVSPRLKVTEARYAHEPERVSIARHHDVDREACPLVELLRGLAASAHEWRTFDEVPSERNETYGQPVSRSLPVWDSRPVARDESLQHLAGSSRMDLQRHGHLRCRPVAEGENLDRTERALP